MKIYQYIMFLTLILFISCGKQFDERIIKRKTATMGTTIDIEIRDFDTDSADVLISEAFNEFRRINDKYSPYIDSNTIWYINFTDDTIDIDDETWYLFQQCDKYHNLTHGRFDPAIGNILKKMGFEGGDKHLPKREDIINLLDSSGWKHIEFLPNQKIIRHNDVKINLSGIVKGYAVDKANSILAEGGAEVYLINAGGEIIANGRDWRIGIQHPRRRGESLYALKVNGKAVATSGDYERYFKKNGKRYSHIIDPVTGYSADHSIGTTVIAEDCISADAMATGVFVLGNPKGIQIINDLPDSECLMVDTTGNVYKSKYFEKFILRK